VQLEPAAVHSAILACSTTVTWNSTRRHACPGAPRRAALPADDRSRLPTAAPLPAATGATRKRILGRFFARSLYVLPKFALGDLDSLVVDHASKSGQECARSFTSPGIVDLVIVMGAVRQSFIFLHLIRVGILMPHQYYVPETIPTLRVQHCLCLGLGSTSVMQFLNTIMRWCLCLQSEE